ncbi:protein KTI12 homolog [Cimex lectularius]|uniref:Protein KTI12 homolog n=1 Tax=Cimex lectularius TaxID=79782 RepID=A0A8I6RE05_CIMLE|nr:protein KTI12 homolog [Cimex lectularius]
MPLLIVVGLPSSGKTTRANEIKEYLSKEHNKVVHLISDNELFAKKSIDKNALVFDAQKEKEVRGCLKSEALRLLEKENVVILDSSNYIKGYRYELYCASKNSKSTQLTLETLGPKEVCWEWNCQRQDGDKYTKEAFDALHLRYEAPDNRNRWDSPLVTLQAGDLLNGLSIYEALFLRKPPPPNQSTQTAPLCSSNFLYELDKTTQDVVNAILSAKKLGLEGSRVKISGFDSCVLDELPSNLTPIQLAKLRRQFLNYTKLHPPSKQNESQMKLAQLFVQFLNTSLNSS